MNKIEFSVFQNTARINEDGLPPMVPLDTIAFEGFCIIEAKADKFWGGESSKNYVSPLLFCPTWGELIKIAENQIKATKDESHYFLESIFDTGKTLMIDGNTASVLNFFMGS